MPTDFYRDERGGLGSRQVKTADEVADAQAKERLGSTAGANLGSKGKALTGAPKQEPGESPASFGERMRKYREAETQKRAFSK